MFLRTIMPSSRPRELSFRSTSSIRLGNRLRRARPRPRTSQHRIPAAPQETPAPARSVVRTLFNLSRHHFFPIVVANHQLRSVVIANFRNRRRVRTTNCTTLRNRTLPAAGESRNNNIIIDFQVDHHGPDRPRPSAPPARSSAWLTVRGYPSRINPGSQSGCSIRSSTSRFTVSSGTSPPACRITLHLQSQLIPPRHPLPQHVAGRNMRQPQRLLQQLGLRPLPRTRGTEQNQAEPVHLQGCSGGSLQILLRRPRIRPARGVKPS